MCGVVGIYSYAAGAPPVSPEELVRVRDHMAARGPDGTGAWFSPDGRVALGHRRLAIIDLSPNGAQPMASAEGSTIISFNGEIYNYRELREFLERRGHRFRTGSDTEVILQLYEREGEAMLPRLRGMFALIIWDARRRGLMLARDPFGIKPLYYADDGATFRVASQVKALMVSGALPDALEPAGCVSFFLLGYVAEPFTIRRAVRALPAGHSLWVDTAGARSPRAFFSLREQLLPEQQTPLRFTVEERRACLAASLADSVKAHLVADVPIGVFLSAGLDSTSIMSLAVRHSARLKTLTVGFTEYRGTGRDEVPIAEAVARQFGTDHTTIWVERDVFVREQGRLFAAMDQPTIDGVNSFFISRAAASAGLKVALSGLGGDELFGGYPSFRQLPRISRLFGPLHAVPALGRAVRIVASHLIGARLSPKFAGLIEYGTSIEDAYLLRRSLYMPWELPRVLDPDIIRDGWAALQPLLSFHASTAGLPRDRLRVAVLEMTWYMRNQLLRDTDWASMAQSLEVRTPLVDVELLRRMVPLLRDRSAPDKLEMAAATPIGGIDAVVRRPKTGFTVPVREWLIEGRRSDGRDAGKAVDERGLRGWAKHVFESYVSQAPVAASAGF